MRETLSIATPERERIMDALETTVFDCIVIGAGITGAGIARELSRCGLSVAVLEAEDFASGTSSRSSKLIHGGLRYLAMGDVALVRETALERKQIRRLAPHLAQRRWMIVPASSRAAQLTLRVGIAMYEKLGAVEPEDRHRNWSPEDLAVEEPLIDRDRHPYACVYREYLTDDSRLVLANLRDAVGMGTLALNHAAVGSILLEGGRASGVEARCRLTGRPIRVSGRCILNAAGPWVEAVRRLEDPDASPMLVLSKGIHIVFPSERLPLRNMVVLRTRDSRSIFLVPRGGIVFVGTTDTLFSEDPTTWPRVTRADVEYLLQPLARSLHVEPPGAHEVVAAWAGLRPLVAQPGKRTTEVSRRDEILVGAAGVISIAGGKLTGYRPMARRVRARVQRELGRKLEASSEEAPLPGGDFEGGIEAYASRLASELGLAAPLALRLVRLYGSETPAVVKLGADPVAEGVSLIGGEVDWAVLCEGAARLEDVVYRRTRLALYEPTERQAAAVGVAHRMAELLGWDAARRADELAGLQERMRSELRFQSSEP